MTGVRLGRCHTAINTAWTISWRSCCGLIDQPTTRPEYKSSTMQRYNQCSAVRMYVLSVTHLVLRAVAVKSRSIRFCVPAGGTPEGFRRQRRRCGIPCKPSSGRPDGGHSAPRRSRVPPTSVDSSAHHRAGCVGHACASPTGHSPSCAHSAAASPSCHIRLADTRQHRHIIRMGSVSRPRWIIRNFISTLSRSTLPLLANNPAPWSPKPALDATGSALHHGVAHCPQTPAWDAAGALVANAPMSSLPRPARPQVGARSPWGHLTSPPLPACTSLKTSASGS